MLKNFYLFALVLFSFAVGTGKATETEPSQILSLDTCFRSPFSSYAEWVTMIRANATRRIDNEIEIEERLNTFRSLFPEEEFGHYRKTINCHTFMYKSGDALVNGYVIRPKNIDGKHPVIIYSRGGNGNYGSVVMGRKVHSLFPLAAEGFIVIGTQYRGTFERAPEYGDEFGGADVEDVTRLLELLTEIPEADMDKIGMLGASRGAMQSYLALKETKQVRALVTIAGNVDLLRDLETRPEMEQVYENRIPNYDINKEHELRRRSAIHWISEIDPDIPILLLHGEDDDRVNARNSIAMAEELSRLGRNYKLVLYPQDGHELSENRDAVFNEIVEWFDAYLQ